MACSPKSRTELVTGIASSVSFATERIAICNSCERNVKGICRSVAAKHGNDRAVIENGVKRPSVACPRGKWGSIPVICPSCTRVIEVDENVGVCKWCQIKRGIEESSGSRRFNRYPDDKRDHSLRERPFTGPPVRHLHFFLYPRFDDSVEYHLDQLEQSSWVFNGRRACCVATDEKAVVSKYKSRIERYFDDVQYVQNNPRRRECVGFVSTLRKLLSDSENDMICFAHGKGQQVHSHNSESIRLWTDAMYETVVRNPSEVEEAMRIGHPIAGAFKCIGAFRSTHYRWHYSGSFWWGRSAAIIENPLRETLCNAWWGTESYVGRHWMPHEGYCTFADGVKCGSIYNADVTQVVRGWLEEWRARNSEG